ncbi:MAG: hypothetical protein F6K50_44605 [Moorea sp. SIO3I7]|nr:hypothetical protein [Moorena sp. SIO3I7]
MTRWCVTGRAVSTGYEAENKSPPLTHPTQRFPIPDSRFPIPYFLRVCGSKASLNPSPI